MFQFQWSPRTGTFLILLIHPYLSPLSELSNFTKSAKIQRIGTGTTRVVSRNNDDDETPDIRYLTVVPTNHMRHKRRQTAERGYEAGRHQAAIRCEKE